MFNPFACIMKSFVHYSFDFLEGAFFAGAFFAGAFAFFSALASTAGASVAASASVLQRFFSSSAASACLSLLSSTVFSVQGIVIHQFDEAHFRVIPKPYIT